MKYLILLILSTTAIGANRPYIDVINEIADKSCAMKKENIYLSKDQRKKIEGMSQTKLYGGLSLRYVITCDNKPTEYLYVDSHIVRTLNETSIVSIKNNIVSNYIVSSFGEPPEYMAPKKWYGQFIGFSGAKILKASVNIDALSGATLTVNSSVNTVNRVMAMHKVLKE
jgi:hypothetical protein